MPRKAIPKKIKEKILSEYNHRCAICAKDNPHVHHIDENPENNNIQNLIPLCPNCHLTDQHNPTRKIEINKLKLFRKYRDPLILMAQFHPIYLRQNFLDELILEHKLASEYETKSEELIEFISKLEMGEFYCNKIGNLLENTSMSFIFYSNDAEGNRKYQDSFLNYIRKLESNRETVQELIIELLRYQKW